jgi:uncharacterized membrane protein
MQVFLMAVQLVVSAAAASLNGLFFGAGFALSAVLVQRRMAQKDAVKLGENPAIKP